MSSDRPLPIVVLCYSEEQAANWNARASRYANAAIRTVVATAGAWTVVRALIAQHDEPIVVCQEHVWLGAEFADHVLSLVEELNRTQTIWGACGNRGCLCDSSTVINYTSSAADPTAGLETACTPKVVFNIDDNALLINCKAFRDLKPFASASTIFGIPLSLECLRQRLPLLVDRRLFTVRTNQHTGEDIATFATAPDFAAYYREHFVNHKFCWPDGEVNLEVCVDYSYTTDPKATGTGADLVKLFEASLALFNGALPSVTLCCRTQFTRMALLRRALGTFSAAQIECSESIRLVVRIITDCTPATAEANTAALGEEFRSLSLECWTHALRPNRYSRTDLLFAAIERAETDYIWFIDDDDYVLPGAAQALTRALVPREESIVVGNALKMQEVWSEGDNSTLIESKLANRFVNQNVFRLLAGANHIPICGFLLPLARVKATLQTRRGLGDYYEDYFVLLSALNDPQADIRLLNADLAGVSYRSAGTTVNQDRSQWNFSYATFVQEILCDKACHPLLWQLGKRVQQDAVQACGEGVSTSTGSSTAVSPPK
jgi:hypothetical protein